jgi:hypothetical protein
MIPQGAEYVKGMIIVIVGGGRRIKAAVPFFLSLYQLKSEWVPVLAAVSTRSSS